MTNYFPDTNEEILAEHAKLVSDKEYIKRKSNYKKKSKDLDGTDNTRVDEQRFDESFNLFKTLVETKSKTVFISFSENIYTRQEEGYKYDVYEKARKALSFGDWKKEDVGTGKIFDFVISAIKINADNVKNNIIHWISIDKFIENKKSENINKYEESFFEFYNNLKSDEDSLFDFIEFFGKNYPLIGYLFFIKDLTKYMPINPNNFDKAFEKLGVQDFKTSGRCSWKNYSRFNGLLNEVKELLSKKGIKDTSLLDAHSFVWMIRDIEKKLDKAGILKK